DHGLPRPAQEQPASERDGDPRGYRGQPVPLYRLPEHRARGAGGGRSDVVTTVESRPELEIGKARRRKEDQHLITGRTTWTDNLTLPGLLHLAILRSPMAHATITSIDTTEAKGRPGVVAVFTGQDFAQTQGNLPCAWPVTADMVNPGAPSLAVTQVNHVGEAVAVIAARTKVAAQDALEAIDVEYEPLE